MSEKKMTLMDTIAPKSDQINYDDVKINPITVTVSGLAMGNSEQPVIIKIKDANTNRQLRDFKPCKSMRRVLIEIWGDKGKDWIGQSMTLYGDADVKYGGVAVGGIRISHMSGIDAPRQIILTVSKAKRSSVTIRPLVLADQAENTETIKQ
jgi:hypothetical protein